MAYHVDIISNKLMTGEQVLLGRVHVDDGGFHIEAADPDQMLDTLRRIVPEIDPDEEPTDFVALLPERVDYTHVIASNPHQADECEFGAVGSTIEITDGAQHHSAQHA